MKKTIDKRKFLCYNNYRKLKKGILAKRKKSKKIKKMLDKINFL
jgi:hypothetical protein